MKSTIAFAYVLIFVISIATASFLSIPVKKDDKVFTTAKNHELVKGLHSKYMQAQMFHNGLNNVDASFTNVPMGGNINPLGIFYIDVSLGTPPQTFQVALDTGSCTLVVPGEGCKGCPPAPNKFNIHGSKTLVPVPCNKEFCPTCTNNNQCAFSNSYETCNLTNPTQTCTISGPVYSDFFSIGGLRGSNKTAFGVITEQTPNFQQLSVIDGIIGFACDTTFGVPIQFEELVDSRLISNQFGICFDTTRQEGGILTLGSPDPKLYTGNFVSTPLIGRKGFLYVIELNDIKVSGKSIGIPSTVYSSNPFDGCVVDSGTNILLLPTQAVRAMKSTFLALCSTNPLRGICDVSRSKTIFDGYCYSVTTSDYNKFPSFDLVFNGATLTLNPFNYLLPSTSDSSEYCLGIMDSGDDGLTIIGDTTMENYYTIFDRENRLMKFAPVNSANCKASSN